jgi:ParB family transcriptional regulator, chromosome partitioning protein
MAQSYGLGRGLSSLIPPKNKKIDKPDESFNYFGSSSGDKSAADPGKKETMYVSVELIVPNPRQPRTDFNKEKLDELALSIKEHGIIQPLVVSRDGSRFELVVGERRLQAAKLAGLTEVPVIVRQASDQQKLELAVIENIQRHDLNPIEEAKSFQKLVDEFDYSQEDLSKKMGKSRSAIANKMRLLQLPIEIQRALAERRITEGHAKAILAVTGSEKQRALFEMIRASNLTVRQAEDKSRLISVKSHKRTVSVDPETKDLENRLTGYFGTKVKLVKSGSGGKIVIEYYSPEELNGILNKFEPGQ